MSFTVSDRVLWLGIGAGIYALVRAVSYGLHDIYNLTEVAPAPDSPRTVAQGTEDDIPLPSLQVLATQHPNLEIRKAAAAIVTTRVLNDQATIRRILADYKKPDGAPDQRAARNAIQLIRTINGIDLEDWEEEHNNNNNNNNNDDDENAAATAAAAAAAAAVEVGFNATGHHGTRSHNPADMRREMASRYWAVEHVDGDAGDWDDASDDNSHAADVMSDDDIEDHDLTVTRTVTAEDISGSVSGAQQQQPPQPSRRAGEFDAFVEADISALFEDLGSRPDDAAAADDGVEAAYGTTNAIFNDGAWMTGGVTTMWDRHGPPPTRRRRGNTSSHVVEDVPRPHGRRHLRARSSRENEEEVARRRVRREAVVVNDGDRPISQDDIIQRPLQRRSY